jgi:hypothetical protein
MIQKSGNRFSEKIMLKLKNLDHDPIQLNWIMVQANAAINQAAEQKLRGLMSNKSCPRPRWHATNDIGLRSGG